MANLSLPALRRWSSVDNQLPSIDSIKRIHVYDFDNTLFNTPLPNSQLWHNNAIGFLQNDKSFYDGSWWHNPSVLASVGDGVEKEERRAWAGWWNETIVELVKLSVEQQSALTVLLTGRSESKFSELITRMLSSKSLKFDMVVLKPEVSPSEEKFKSTMLFKQAFLGQLLKTYKQTEEFKIYEDRPRHVEAFTSYLKELVGQNSDGPATVHQLKSVEVIPVAPASTTLDPLTETVQVQKMIQSHNLAVSSGAAPAGSKPWCLKRNILYSGYLIDPADSDKLLNIANLDAPIIQEESLRTMANCVLITSRPLNGPLREKVGGLGAKLKWRVVALGVYNQKVWAARVEPVPLTAPFAVEGDVPCVVLARKFDARPFDATRIETWSPIPPDKQIEFDTVVGEKVLLRVEEGKLQKPQRSDTNRPQQPGQKRPLPAEEYIPLNQPDQPKNGEIRPLPRGPGAPGSHRNAAMGRGGRASYRGGRGPPRGPSNSGTGRGGKRAGHGIPYQSRDDQTNKRPFGTDGANDDGGLVY